MLSLGSQATSGPINSIVTNVPGPQFPLYLQGAKLLSVFPQVPLLGEMGVGIALMSYDGKVCWGFNANPDVIPDLDVFVNQIKKSLDTLTEICAPESKKGAEVEASPSEEARPTVTAVQPDPIPFPNQRNGSEG